MLLLAFAYVVMGTYPAPIVPILAGIGTFVLLGRRETQDAPSAVGLSAGVALALYAMIMGIATWAGLFFWGI